MAIDSIALLLNNYNLIYQLGYVGIFLSSLISASTIFFPIPLQILVFGVSSFLDPVLVTVAATIGNVIGNFFIYVIGLGGKELLEKKYGTELNHIRKLFEKYAPSFWIFIVALTPLPFEYPVAIFCGMIRYDLKKYLAAFTVGKFISFIVFALAGYYSISWVANYLKIITIG